MTGGNITQHIAVHVQTSLGAGRERGASMVEYAMLLILVLVVALGSLVFFGDSVVAIFDAGADGFDSQARTSTN